MASGAYSSIRTSQVVRIILFITLASLLYGYFNSDDYNPRKGRNFRRPKFQKKLKQDTVMASAYLKNIANRRTIYALQKASSISDSRIQEILTETIKHTPSSFNSQAGRAVLLLKSEHDTLWDLGHDAVKSNLPQAYDGLKPKIDGYKAAYGTILFFEDQETLDGMKSKNPGMPFDQWSEHSSGMLQIHTWDALELEGLGANLQHYNFIPNFSKQVKEKWNLPEKWDLKSQMVFGTPAAPAKEKTFLPIEGTRLLVFGQ
ncbi:hypothetical protein H2198_007449 [Neophaeococcomyces mojaviensis]|uniref:Uncharacterized protein n=1 Tax=Neophaeococcomyces mojaviensis TaxID=3383035 RepID=A0ACC2ZZX9_9EURO|nr:hypothetical protein H2198_007449 [Knufia sp. JES_112]